MSELINYSAIFMKNKPVIIISAIVLIAFAFIAGFKYRNIRFKTSTNSQTANNNELFAKKTECQKYQDDVEKKLNDSDAFVAETGAQMVNKFDKIFYSPKANSCLYVSTQITFVKGKRTIEMPTLKDALSGETLLSGIREWNTSDYEAQVNRFEAGVKEYE